MSIFSGVGKEILEKEKQEQNQEEVKGIRKYLTKKNPTVKVRIPSDEDFREFYQHGGYNLAQKYQVYNCVCLFMVNGVEDPYDKAVKVLYEDRNQHPEGSDEYNRINLIASELRAKRRMLFGFFDLETGDPIVLDVTGNQGSKLIAQIQEYEDNINDFAFKVTKSGEKANTTIDLMPIMNPKKGLTEEEQKNFESTAGKEFDHTLYEKILFVKDHKYMIQDLEKIGFDVARIGYEPTNNQEIKQESGQDSMPDITEDELPF